LTHDLHRNTPISSPKQCAVQITIQSCLPEMRQRLDEAASIAQAAQARADGGNVAKGVEIALDLDQLVQEVQTFLGARPRGCTDAPCGGAIPNNPLFSNYPNAR
jgi:hypothetical protein